MAGSRDDSNTQKKRGRRRRREVSLDLSSSSSDDSGSESEAKAVSPAVQVAQEVVPPVSSDSDTSDWQSSDSEDSADEITRKRRRRKGKPEADKAESPAVATPLKKEERAYPQRTPSPVPATVKETMLDTLRARMNPANVVPIAQDEFFPLFKAVPEGEPIIKMAVQPSEDIKQKEKHHAFKEDWRKRFVNEYESELGSLAGEQGLNQTRLGMLLSSLNSLADLHTSSDAASGSVWKHIAGTVDPAAKDHLDIINSILPEFSLKTVDSKGDFEIGEEGVNEETVAMDVD